MPTAEELEAEVAALEAKVKAAKTAKGRPTARKEVASSDAPTRRARKAVAERAVRTPSLKELNANAKSMHSGYEGPTLIQRIQALMDKQHKGSLTYIKETSTSENGARADVMMARVEGLAAALGILRSSSMKDEMQFSLERIGEE